MSVSVGRAVWLYGGEHVSLSLALYVYEEASVLRLAERASRVCSSRRGVWTVKGTGTREGGEAEEKGEREDDLPAQSQQSVRPLVVFLPLWTESAQVVYTAEAFPCLRCLSLCLGLCVGVHASCCTEPSRCVEEWSPSTCPPRLSSVHLSVCLFSFALSLPRLLCLRVVGRRISKGRGRVLVKSKYDEDVHVGNHTSVFGSWYNPATQAWGYACCKQTNFHADCTVSKPRRTRTLLSSTRLRASCTRSVPASVSLCKLFLLCTCLSLYVCLCAWMSMYVWTCRAACACMGE